MFQVAALVPATVLLESQAVHDDLCTVLHDERWAEVPGSGGCAVSLAIQD